jgi:hypothetical protein
MTKAYLLTYSTPAARRLQHKGEVPRFTRQLFVTAEVLSAKQTQAAIIVHYCYKKTAAHFCQWRRSRNSSRAIVVYRLSTLHVLQALGLFAGCAQPARMVAIAGIRPGSLQCDLACRHGRQGIA